MTYYRYMRFYNDGHLLYAMNTVHPTDMARQLRPGVAEEKKIYVGTYTLTGRRLEVSVQLHYCTMFFTLSVQDADDGWVGKHNMLTLESHSCGGIQSDTPGAFDQRVMFHNNHEICNYLFWRQWYWHG